MPPHCPHQTHTNSLLKPNPSCNSSPAACQHPQPKSFFSTRSKSNLTHGRPPDPRPSRADRRHPHRSNPHEVHGGHPAREKPPPAQRARHSLRGRRPNPPRRQRRHPGPPGRRPRLPRDDPPRARSPRLGAPRDVHYRQDRRGARSALFLGPSRAGGEWNGDDSCVHAQRIPRRLLTTGSAVKTLKGYPPCTYRNPVFSFTFSTHALCSMCPKCSCMLYPTVYLFAMYCFPLV
ncbi:hypothetical protein B0H16DRAFT_648281 [Mycena metata]|uniref:Uncharacterized protein n=1 Tax=Mycena metata TaxID=1033252 RepID=A0AAD7MC13_9AGAR|nr:hypothetical protein B0H16DRAFT_648281 [Mycena metata]